MAQSLPPRPNLDWLKKLAKERLGGLRAVDPSAKLHHAQLAVAREYGFASWRKLKAHVESLITDPVKEAKVVSVALDEATVQQVREALRADEPARWIALFDARPDLVTARLPGGQTLLHAAAEQEATNGLGILIDRGADAAALFAESGHTALSWAVTCNARQSASVLIARGIMPDLFCSAGLGLLDRVQTFFDEVGMLRSGASTTGSSRYAPDGVRLPCPPLTAIEVISDALCFACRNGHAEVVRFLLTRSPDLSFKGYMGASALHWAYYGGSHSAVKQLIQAGADTSARDDALACTPCAFGICVPANWGFAEMVRDRLADDPTLSTFMDGRTSALHEAARAGHARIVRLLLDAGAKTEQVNGDGVKALELAVRERHGEVVALLQKA